MLKPLRAALWVCLAVVATLFGLRGLGALQPLELAAYDRLLSRVERPTAVSTRIALIEISELDIQELGHWPPTDLEISMLIESILDAGANAVGLDIYRDLPVAPGQEDFERLLEREPGIVLVFKHGDPSAGGIPGRATLAGTGRLGFSDLLLDPDGRVRRALLFLDRRDGGTDYAFPLQLAIQQLARDGIFPRPDPVRAEWLRLGDTSIPFLESRDGGYSQIDDKGYQVMLDFHQSRGDFASISFHEALAGKLEADSLTGRIVIVGASADSLNDFALVPVGIAHGVTMERGVTGVWLHAVFLDQILRFAHGESHPLRFVSGSAEIIVVLVAAIFGCLLAALVGRLTSLSTIALAGGVASGVLLLAGSGYYALSTGTWLPVVAPVLSWLGTSIAYTAWISGHDRARRADLMQIFSQVQSPRVAEEIWRRRDEYLVNGRLEPETATVTVLFLDMKGYTASAEKMEPTQLMSWINEFMAPMARLIEEHGGYPDDYFGDGIKADFGVPILSRTDEEIAHTAQDAVRCAVAMVEELEQINAGYLRSGLPTVALRIGLHTGPVVVGLLGSVNKGKYTVVGDAVVTAQRLESTDKVQHDFAKQPCRVLLSERTHSLLAGQDGLGRYESMGSVALKGKERIVTVYRLTMGSVQETVSSMGPVHVEDQ